MNEKRVLFSYGFELNLSHVTWVQTSPTSWVTSTYGWNNSQFSKRETSSLYKHRCLKTIGKLRQPSQNSPTARSSFREKSGCGRASMQNSSQMLFSFFSCFFSLMHRECRFHGGWIWWHMGNTRQMPRQNKKHLRSCEMIPLRTTVKLQNNIVK